MKRMIYLILAVLACAACHRNDRRFTLNGRIDGLTDSVALVVITDTAWSRIDTIRIAQGRFSYELETDTAVPLMLLFPEGRSITLFAERGTESTLEGKAAAWDSLRLGGGAANEQLASFRRTASSLAGQALKDSLRSFIQRNPFSPVGVVLLDQYFVQVPHPDVASVKELIGYMGGKLQDNLTVQDIQRHLDETLAADSGKYIPSFRLKNVKGDFVNAYQFNNRYVLMGFWASWHPASVAAQKELGRLVKRLKGKDKEVGFVQLSLDTDKQRWKDTVERDTLGGEQCYDQDGWDSRTVKQFAVNSLPTFVLLDKQRRILGRSNRLADIDSLLVRKLHEDATKKE